MNRPRYIRPSVPVGPSLPGALRRLRDALNSTLAADLIAGVPLVQSHDLERIADAVMGAHFELTELVDVARGDRVVLPGHEAPGTVRHCFDVMHAGQVVKCIIVPALAHEADAARVIALAQIADAPGHFLMRESRILPTATE